MHKQFDSHSQSLRKIGPRVDDIDDIIASKDETCAICTNELGTEAVRIKLAACGHEFHTYCLQNWFLGQGKTTCPMCRTEFADADTEYMITQIETLLRSEVIVRTIDQDIVFDLEAKNARLKVLLIERYDIAQERNAEQLLTIRGLTEERDTLNTLFIEEEKRSTRLNARLQNVIKRLRETKQTISDSIRTMLNSIENQY